MTPQKFCTIQYVSYVYRLPVKSLGSLGKNALAKISHALENLLICSLCPKFNKYKIEGIS